MGVVKHGRSRTKVYMVWTSMIARCTRPTAADYPRYGGKGITICDRWRFGEGGQSGFSLFIEDVGDRPSDVHSIDRIDNDRGYEPGNVRWALPVDQMNNKSNNRLVIYRGRQMTAAQATLAAGSVVTRETMIGRLKSGWSVVDAVETPPKWRGGGLSGKRVA